MKKWAVSKTRLVKLMPGAAEDPNVAYTVIFMDGRLDYLIILNQMFCHYKSELPLYPVRKKKKTMHTELCKRVF